MSDQNKLREILRGLEAMYVNADAVSGEEEIYNFKEAEQAILEWVNEVIGEDEQQRWDDEDGFCQTCDFTRSDDSKECICILHNQLKAEQRRRAGL